MRSNRRDGWSCSRPLRVRLFDQASIGQRAADQPLHETGDRQAAQRGGALQGRPARIHRTYIGKLEAEGVIQRQR